MDTLKGRPYGNEYRTTLVCVDSYDNGIPTGRFYNPYLEQGVPFGNVMEFLSRMEDALDKMNFPQSFVAVRSFTKPAGVSKGPAEEKQEGKLATFALRVLFRQNASWQGSVRHLEQQCEESFRSVLELLFLVDSALKEQTAQ